MSLFSNIKDRKGLPLAAEYVSTSRHPLYCLFNILVSFFFNLMQVRLIWEEGAQLKKNGSIY